MLLHPLYATPPPGVTKNTDMKIWQFPLYMAYFLAINDHSTSQVATEQIFMFLESGEQGEWVGY